MGIVDNDMRILYPYDLPVGSTARPIVLARMLQHSKELNLTEEQIAKLLGIARRHYDDWRRISIEFVNISAQLDLLELRPNLEQKRRLLGDHARLFQDHEGLMLRAFEEARAVLTAQQLRQWREIHGRERQAALRGLLPGLRRALRPGFTIVPVKPS